MVADGAGELACAYVHIPFCHRVCPYCDFAVVEGRLDLTDRYLSALVREIGESAPWRKLDAIFVGGGTPSAIAPDELGRVLDALDRRFGLSNRAEITIEANPEDWTADKASALRNNGFNRVSLGVQSFDPAVLESLGRRHQPADIQRAAGVSGNWDSVSVDLIFGTPGESLASWEATVGEAIELGVDHVSTYSLTVEPGTELWRDVRAGRPAPDPDDQAEKWETANRMLLGAGFVRYEVSNYAKGGHHCRYNLAVWDQGEYAAFGLGAHGFRHGVRTANVRRLDTYMDRVERGLGPVQVADPVGGWAAEQERLMLGLRRAAGVELGPGGRLLVESLDGERLLDAGVIEVVGDRLVVTRPLLTDEVVRAVLALEEPGG